MESPLELVESTLAVPYSNWVYKALDELTDNFTITDPCISGHPIVFASQGFLKMCGYSKEEVIGRNGRMFQGPRTNRRSVMAIREAIREERTFQINLLNYRKDGTPFWMLFHVSPVFRKEDGRVTHFIGVQLPISRKPKRWHGVAGRDGLELLRKDGANSCEISVGACRREVCCSDSALVLPCGLSYQSVPDLKNEEELNDLCEASEAEKQKVLNAVDNVLSLLCNYSELTGKSVTGRRCNFQGINVLSAALLIPLGRIKQSFVLVDPHLPNLPIVYASDAFLNLTGYARDEVLGHSRKLLFGPDTNPSTILQMDDSIQNGQGCKLRILSYRKDKSSFWNMAHIAPIRNASGKIAYFVEVQMEEDDKYGEEEEDNNRPNYGSDCSNTTPSSKLRILGAIGAVKVAVRSQSMCSEGPSSY